jgi:hypothetical protein
VNISSPQSLESISFPALTFNRGWLLAVDSADCLSRSSRLGFKRRYWEDLVVVDSASNRFQVIGAKKIRTIVGFSFGNLLGLLSGNPKWEVELTLAQPSRISLEEVRKLISNSFREHEDYWEEMTDFEEFRDKVIAVESLERELPA